ncbi:3'-5' exonuclease [Solibacillus sp.]|uniref:3'-5' exonuclease n=1 Tax=Solibacillus sp. TaxID=1909654 RepID=UPI003314E8D4
MEHKQQMQLMIEEHNEYQDELLEEAVDGLEEQIRKELDKKCKANYLPATYKYELDRVNKTVEGIKTNLTIALENAGGGKRIRRYYEEDDLALHMGDSRIKEAAALVDNPYFARIDFVKDHARLGETIYIGNEDIASATISWRNPIAKLYYEKNFGKRYRIDGYDVELERYRNIDIEGGQLKELHPLQTEKLAIDELLVKNLAEKRGAEMKSLVETLQAEQYELVSLPLENAIVVQGSAGSGKSVIALHRLSYLLYEHPHLQAKKLAVFGPNPLFLKHVENVLPELGEKDIVQTTLKLYLEQVMLLRRPIEEIDRMIFSEVNDLSANEGKAQALQAFEHYTEMRQLKGSFEFKRYIEQYAKYITSNLAPFLHTIQVGKYSVSAIEIAHFVHQQPHFGKSKEALKHYVQQAIRDKAKEAATIFDATEKIIMDEVAHFLTDLQQQKHLLLTNDVIEQYCAKVLTIEQQMKFLKQEDYRPISESDSYKKAMLITDEEKREMRLKKAASEKVESLKFDLKEAKKQLQQAIEQKRKHDIEALTPLFVVREETAKKLTEKALLYNELFEKQFKWAQISSLFNAKSFVSFEEIQAYLLDVQTIYMQDIDQLWLMEKTTYRKELTSFMETCVKQQMAQQYAKAIALTYEGQQLSFSDYNVNQVTRPAVALHFEEAFAQIERYYNLCVDDIYMQIIHDEFGYNAQLQVNYQDLLAAYTQIEKHDLAPLFVIHQWLTASDEKPFQYLIVDEAQDYTAFEMDVFNALTEQIMLMGDLGQNLTPSSQLRSWSDFEQAIGPFSYYELKATYRSTNQIVTYCNDIIRPFSEGKYNLPVLTFRNGDKVQTVVKPGMLIYPGIADLVRQCIAEQSKDSKIAIIAKTNREAKNLHEKLENEAIHLQIGIEQANAQVIITTPVLAKGLEFDTVIIFRGTRFEVKDPYDTRLKYVAASRALHNLYVFS